MRPKLTYANIVATLALFIALGGASYAALKLPKNSVGTKQLKKNAVTTAKIKDKGITAAKIANGAITGTQINLSTLGTVPTANAAQTANTAQTADIAKSVAPSEPWHLVGAPGEPGFNSTWENFGESFEPAGFYKDREGIVHLRGFVTGDGSNSRIFNLPPGYRPAAGKAISFAVNCTEESCNTPVGIAVIEGSGTANPDFAGAVLISAIRASLNGIDFRAES